MMGVKNRIVGSGVEKLDNILFNPRNWRIHPLNQQNALNGVLDEVGWVQEVIVNQRTGNLVDGHLRCQLASRKGETEIPVKYVDLSEEEEALVLATIDPIGAMAATDKEKLDELFTSIQSDNAGVNKMLDEIKLKEIGFDISTEKQKEEVKKEKTKRDIDLIFTIGVIGQKATDRPSKVMTTCCVACKSGWLYGVQSTGSAGRCAVSEYQKSHKVAFLDNEFKNYNHQDHLAAAKLLTPKYCTVRDVMSKEQCAEAEIPYYSLEQILDWAEELNQYCENVIVIPKEYVLDKIPEKFMLGYSVPTKYGGTPIPIQEFKGRRVHLLGGSPNKQIAYWQQIENDVKSIDNNYILKMANYGQAWFPDGTTRSVTEMGYGMVTNPLYIAITASLGNMAAAFWKVGAEDARVENAVFGETNE